MRIYCREYNRSFVMDGSGYPNNMKMINNPDTLDYLYGHTSLHNHKNETRALKKSTLELLPNHLVKDRDPFMGAEDLSFYLKEVPGTFFFVGVKTNH